jgi:hypothetical protein
MAEANHSLSQIQTRITTASIVLALQRARRGQRRSQRSLANILMRIRSWSPTQGQLSRVGLREEYSANAPSAPRMSLNQRLRLCRT